MYSLSVDASASSLSNSRLSSMLGEYVSKKIGVYINILPSFGGGYQYVEFILDALQNLCNDDFDIVVFTLDDEWERIIHDKYHNMTRCRISFKEPEIIIETINSSDCDYIIIPFCNDDSWIAARFSIPFIVTIHDVMQYYFKRDFNMDIYGIHRIIYLHQRNLRRAMGVLVDSELGREQLVNVCGMIYEDKVLVQPFRVPNYLYDELEERPASLHCSKFIFYPATLTDHKNHAGILLALEQLRNEGLLVNMVFTGEPTEYYKNIKRLAMKLGLNDQVEFIGYVSGAQMKWLYKNARAMIMPCYAGPTNIPPLEAMLMGCPLIISHKWSMPEQVGDAALYVNPEFHLSISSAIKRIWLDDDICKELSQRGKKRAKQFTKEKFNDNFKKNLYNLISRYESEFSDLHLLLKLCRTGRLFVYGAGKYGAITVSYLKASNVHIDGIIVSKLDNNPGEIFDIEVMPLDKVSNQMKGARVVLALSEKFHLQVKDTIKKKVTVDVNYTIVTEKMVNDMETLVKFGMLD